MLFNLKQNNIISNNYKYILGVKLRVCKMFKIIRTKFANTWNGWDSNTQSVDNEQSAEPLDHGIIL